MLFRSNTPYNTYVIAGLPPGPICNPGRASILAATNPLPRDRSIYFVADGTGGHAFATNLTQHLRNVERWRDIQRQRQEQGLPAIPPATSPPATTPPATPARQQ